MTSHIFDPVKSEAFAERLVEALNSAAVVLLASIGHQVGLFDVMAEEPPATSHYIAARSNLNERYVREWLGAMVTGRVIDYDPATGAYLLPAEHAAWLTRSAGPNNLARTMQFIPVLAQAEAPLIDAFRNGGGVPYSLYPQIQRVMAEDTGVTHDALLLEVILPLVPGVLERLDAGIEVCEIGCGSGHGLNIMAQAFPKSHFVGYDLSEQGIRTARNEAQSRRLTNVHFEIRDVSTLDAPDRFGLVTAYDAVHDMAQPLEVLKGVANALHPDGSFLMVEFRASSHIHENLDLTIAPFLYAASCMHCVAVSMAANGPGLGAMWGEQAAKEMLAAAGFSCVEKKQIEGDLFNNYYIATKGQKG